MHEAKCNIWNSIQKLHTIPAGKYNTWSDAQYMQGNSIYGGNHTAWINTQDIKQHRTTQIVSSDIWKNWVKKKGSDEPWNCRYFSQR